MKIQSVDAFLLSCPLPEPVKLRYYGGERTILKRDAMIVRVETEPGLVGFGPGPAHEEALHRIREFIAPFLVGRDLREPDALRILFAQQAGVTLADLKLYSAVELALYDLTAKSFGVSVADLWGGPVRDEIRLYGSAGMYQPPAGYAAEAEAIVEQGFCAYKFRPGLGPEEDLEVVRKCRDAVGPDIELMVDAHTWWRMGDKSYTPAQVKTLAAEIGKLGAHWLEEPLPPMDHAAYSQLKDEDLVPLATGEHEPDEAGFSDLIALRCVDFLQMDIVCQGGYAAGKRLLMDLDRAGLAFAFHSWGTALEVVAAAHLGVCFSENTAAWLEYPVYRTAEIPVMYPFPLASELLKDPLDIRRSHLYLDLKKPGFGIEIDMSVVDRYPWIPGPWSFFTLDSPRETWAVTGDHSLRWADEVRA